jgi:hypothetical protein
MSPAWKFEEPPGALGQIDGIMDPTVLGITHLGIDWEHQALACGSD